MSSAFVVGLGLGAFVAAQLGPMSLLLIRTVMRGALMSGLAIGCAVAIVDTLYAMLGVAGAAPLLQIDALRLGLGLVGAAVLAGLGARTIWSAFRVRPSRAPGPSCSAGCWEHTRCATSERRLYHCGDTAKACRGCRPRTRSPCRSMCSARLGSMRVTRSSSGAQAPAAWSSSAFLDAADANHRRAVRVITAAMAGRDPRAAAALRDAEVLTFDRRLVRVAAAEAVQPYAIAQIASAGRPTLSDRNETSPMAR